MPSNKATIEFYYDIVCPWAYIASERIESLIADVEIQWKPVLLGGIYELTKAPQGKQGSASEVMNLNKRNAHKKELDLTIKRYGLSLNFPSAHPMRSVKALRLICATKNEYRAVLSHKLYHAYWVDNKDITSSKVLLELAKDLGIPFDVELNEELFAKEEYRQILFKNTNKAVERGAPGVPCFWIPNITENKSLGLNPNENNLRGKLFWGQDRLHFVQAHLTSVGTGSPIYENPRISELFPFNSKCVSTKSDIKKTLTVYFDFASPWSYVGYKQLAWTLDEIRNKYGVLVQLELVPVLVGAIFKEVGTNMLPMTTFSEQKRNYVNQDIQDWIYWWNEVRQETNQRLGEKKYERLTFQYSNHFPLRTTLPLRVATLDGRTVESIYNAAWSDNIDITLPSELSKVLKLAGFSQAEEMIKRSYNEDIKAQLRSNTARAISQGVFGVPSFQVCQGEVIWGQDRLDIVIDQLVNETFSTPIQESKL